MQKLFRSKAFYYIFMFWVGLDVFNQLLNLGQPTSFLSLQIQKVIMLIICIFTFICFFFNFKINHSIFKIYLYFKQIIFPLFMILYLSKDSILYGISIEEKVSIEIFALFIFNLFAGLMLLFFYKKYKVE